MTTWHVEPTVTQGRRKASESVWRQELFTQPKPAITPYKPSQQGSEGFVLLSALIISLVAMIILVACGSQLNEWFWGRQREQRKELCIKEAIAMGISASQAVSECRSRYDYR